jgi:hypothetical protein
MTDKISNRPPAYNGKSLVKGANKPGELQARTGAEAASSQGPLPPVAGRAATSPDDVMRFMHNHALQGVRLKRILPDQATTSTDAITRDMDSFYKRFPPEVFEQQLTEIVANSASSFENLAKNLHPVHSEAIQQWLNKHQGEVVILPELFPASSKAGGNTATS